MKPRLICLNGRDESKIYELILPEGERFSIGRSNSNDLAILETGISRHHCEIFADSDNFVLRDLQSHNGTIVNNKTVSEYVLKHGDHLRVGSNLFLFLVEDSDEVDYSARFDDLLVTKTETIFYAEEGFANAAPYLDSLVKLGRALDEAENADDLQKNFLRIILESVPAKRGAILFFDDGDDEPKSAVIVGGDHEMTVSRTVCERVRSGKIALLSNDLAFHDLQFSESLLYSQITSLLAVPLRLGNEQDGLIYLDTDDLETQFSDENLQQTTAVSFLLSAALQQKFLIKDLEEENRFLHESLHLETGIIGKSAAVNEILGLIARVSQTNATVLINGESGTGKELAAKAIHYNSPRRKKPFVAVNCALLGENLIESELFGHEKGAFTDAATQKKGKFELAEGGTIFLDEIGELIPKIQAKLLRVLQEREFERVGGTRPIKTNVRVIAATNRNLQAEIAAGRFREDLYFRLNVVEINMPPLRERKSDIPALVKHFIQKHSHLCGRKVTGITPETMEFLVKNKWRGNIRELENAVERAIVIGTTEIILPEDLPSAIVKGMSGAEVDLQGDYNQQVRTAKKMIVRNAMRKAAGDYTQAAELLGINRNNLHRLLTDLELREEF
ncbi:hypothetical protein BH10ACI1_BH10ACI1_20500 [soil metagenome]